MVYKVWEMHLDKCGRLNNEEIIFQTESKEEAVKAALKAHDPKEKNCEIEIRESDGNEENGYETVDYMGKFVYTLRDYRDSSFFLEGTISDIKKYLGCTDSKVIDYYDLMEYIDRQNDGMAEYYIED